MAAIGMVFLTLLRPGDQIVHSTPLLQAVWSHEAVSPLAPSVAPLVPVLTLVDLVFQVVVMVVLVVVQLLLTAPAPLVWEVLEQQIKVIMVEMAT